MLKEFTNDPLGVGVQVGSTIIQVLKIRKFSKKKRASFLRCLEANIYVFKKIFLTLDPDAEKFEKPDPDPEKFENRIRIQAKPPNPDPKPCVGHPVGK